ncbi:hypothetical protein ACOSP7_022219 [Xanthoceras sorbifolium]
MNKFHQTAALDLSPTGQLAHHQHSTTLWFYLPPRARLPRLCSSQGLKLFPCDYVFVRAPVVDPTLFVLYHELGLGLDDRITIDALESFSESLLSPKKEIHLLEVPQLPSVRHQLILQIELSLKILNNFGSEMGEDPTGNEKLMSGSGASTSNTFCFFFVGVGDGVAVGLDIVRVRAAVNCERHMSISLKSSHVIKTSPSVIVHDQHNVDLSRPTLHECPVLYKKIWSKACMSREMGIFLGGKIGKMGHLVRECPENGQNVVNESQLHFGAWIIAGGACLIRLGLGFEGCFAVDRIGRGEEILRGVNGTTQHRGCVRGLGFGVTPTKVIDVLHPSRPNVSKAELKEKLERMYDLKSESSTFVFKFRTHFGGGMSIGFGLIYDYGECKEV